MQSSVRTAGPAAASAPGTLGSRGVVEAYLLLAFTMVTWGANSVAARLAVGQLSPMVVVSFRWAIVAVVLGVALRRDLVLAWPVLRRRWLQVSLMAVSGFCLFNALYYIAAYHTTAVNMSILQGAVPVLVFIGPPQSSPAGIPGREGNGNLFRRGS